MSITKFLTDENNNVLVDENGRPLAINLDEGEAGLAENGIPQGGTAGQILKKVDSTDYNAEWADLDESGKLPEGGTVGQVLMKKDGTDYNAEWQDIPESGVKKNEIIERAALAENPNDENADFVDNGSGIFAKATNGEDVVSNTIALPTVPESINMYASSALGSDGNIYIFGYSGNIISFNPETSEYTTLDVKLPTTLYDSTATAFNDKIYLFGGGAEATYTSNSKYIFEFDVINKTIKEADIQLSFSTRNMASVKVGNYIYLFGGDNFSNKAHTYSNRAYRFSPYENTLVELPNQMPYYMYSFECSYFNGNIYIFGGFGGTKSSTSSANRLNKIIKFDITTNIFEELDETLPYSISSYCLIKKSGRFYIIGGTSSVTAIHSSAIEFNPNTKETKIIESVLPSANYGMCSATYNNDAYIFGGQMNFTGAFKWEYGITQLYKYITIPQKTSDIKNDSNLYEKPTEGIPETDLSAEIIAKLNRTIPTKTSDIENDSDFYAKPTDGIPETDLSQEVQNKLNESGGASYTLPIASKTVLGGVQPETKTSEMTQTVGVDTDGKLWSKKESVTSVNGKTGEVVIGLDDINGLNEALESSATDEDLTAEKNARQGADTTLQNNIDAEATARENADTTLQNNITAEATARQSADNNLQTQITANTNALGTKADTTALTAETTARQNADSGLQQQITAAQAKADTSVQYVAQTLNQSEKEQALINLGIANRPNAQGILNTLNAYNNMYVGADSAVGARLYLQGQEFAATSPVYVNQDTAAWEAFATSFDWATYGSDVSGTWYFQPFAVLSSAGGGERGGITITKNQSTGAISALFAGGGDITTFATYTSADGWTISQSSLSFSWAYIVSEVVAQDAWYQLFGQSANFTAVTKPSGGGGSVPVLLWSGSWNGRSIISVPNINKYSMFLIKTDIAEDFYLGVVGLSPLPDAIRTICVTIFDGAYVYQNTKSSLCIKFVLFVDATEQIIKGSTFRQDGMFAETTYDITTEIRGYIGMDSPPSNITAIYGITEMPS